MPNPRSSWRLLAAALLLAALQACSSANPSASAEPPALPPFPDYAPAAPFLAERQRVIEQRRAQEAYSIHLREEFDRANAERSQRMWARMEARRAQLEREAAFKKSIVREVNTAYLSDLPAYQGLQR